MVQCASLRIFPEQLPRLVIDANVASELMRPEPTPTVAARIAGRVTEELCLTAVIEAELFYGVAIMPTSRRRNALEVAVSRWLDLGFADRILPFNSSAPSLRGDRIGRALKGSRLGVLWEYRIGDCRIITHIEDNAVRVLMVRVARRDRVYQ